MDAFIGTILIWAPTFAPQGWSYCDGSMMSVQQNQALYSLLGTTYGGNGQTTFGLPDLRGRVPVGSGQGPSLSPYAMGQTGGLEGVTLQMTQMPQHTHPGTGEVVAVNAAATSDAPLAGGYLATGNTMITRSTPTNLYAPTSSTPVKLAVGSVDVQVGVAGGSLPHENRQPFLGLGMIICLFGIYPSRQ